MPVEADVLEQLVQHSHSSDTEVRSAAVKQILALPDEALLQLLANRSRHTGATGRRMVKRMVDAFLYTAFALAIAVSLCKGTSADPRILWSFTFLGVCFAVILLVTWGYGIRSLERYGRAVCGNPGTIQSLPLPMVLLLAGRTDRRFLPDILSEIALQYSMFERARTGTDRIPATLPLAPAFIPMAHYQPAVPHEFVQYRRRYRKIVQGILAQIRPEEAIELTAEERYGLLLLLYIPEEDVNLTLCILSRLPCWGDAQSVPVLKRLIREKHWYVGSERVEAAARRCLEEVETRLKRQKQGSTLLRPIEGIDVALPGALLRPATESAENASEQLLRPMSSAPPEDSQ